jgi:tetratricopeptide (TPR) repeat protein
MLDCQLFGLNAWGHHLTSVLLHAATSIALFLVWWRITDELWPSAFVATVFAVHPQHVESVAWVAERRDVLSGLFFVLTLSAYLSYVRHGRSLWRYLLVMALFALGLMSKPMLVTLPPLLLLLDFWPLARFGSAIDVPGWTLKLQRPSALRLVLEKLPLVVLAVGDCVMTLRTHAGKDAPLAWSERIGNAAISCVTYIVQFFYPVDLAAFYPFPLGGPPAWKVAGAVAILAVISAAAVVGRRRYPYFFVGWFWYLGMLSPVLGVVNVSDHAMADRYMYLPGIGLYIALAWGAARLAGDSLAGRWVLGTCAGLAVAVLVAGAAWQTSFWRDDEALWMHALACTTDNEKAEFCAANALAHRGHPEEAIVHYRRALPHATDSSPYENLGLVLHQLGKLDEAIAEYQQALAIDPDSFRAHENLGGALAAQGRLSEAMEHFRRALEIEPRSAKAHCGLGQVLFLQKRIDEAVAEFFRAIELDPRSAVAHNNLGGAFAEQGEIDAAIAHFEEAVAFDPRYLQAHLNLARALATRGRIDEAIAHYRRALEIDRNNPVARQSLDRLLHDNDFLLKP